MASNRRQLGVSDLSARVGDPSDAHRVTVNLSREIGFELHGSAQRCRVSESSIVEIALRQLFRRVDRPALERFLRENGACLRRRRS
ncbi:MAG TPA: hypothetical protein VFF63_01885 [Candidatus Babeliales bacterium]|nr:hypothetical protein [Candidatus Babeliales bacterium]